MARALTLTALLALALALPLGTAETASGANGNLYLQHAAGGVLKGSKLVLRGVSARTVQFSDRPARLGGAVPTRRFVRGWKRAFRGDPPNAALEVAGAPRSRDVALLELRNPRYHPRGRTLVYTVRPLNDLRGNRLAPLERRGDRRSPRRFGRATLFIDPGAATAPLELVVDVPTGEAVQVQLGNTTFDYGTGSFLAGIRTPTAGGGSFEISTGAVNLRPSSMSFRASPGGGGMKMQLVFFVDVPASRTLSGTATVPGGARLEIANAGEAGTRIPNGPFKFPVKEEEG